MLLSNSDKQKEVMENILIAAPCLYRSLLFKLILNSQIIKSAPEKEQQDYVAFHDGVCVHPFDKLSS